MLPLLDLKAQYKQIAREIDEAVLRVVRSGRYILGKEIDAFEHEFAEYCGVRYCVATGCGLDALRMSLRGLQVGPGDEVILPANTFIATAFAVSQLRAHVVLVDCDFYTHLMNISQVIDRIGPNTKAVIPVHLYGQCADLQYLKVIQEEFQHSFAIVEDACQAHGACADEGGAGAMGDTGCFSFYPGKNLGCYGDGGAIVGDDSNPLWYARRLGNYGQLEKYEHMLQGCNSRLDEIQAAVLRVKLPHLDAWNARRREVADWYARIFADEGVEEVVLPEMAKGNVCHVYHQYVVRVPRRDEALKQMQAQGIGVGIHYPVPIHLQEAYRSMGKPVGSYPVAEQAGREVMSLPIDPQMTASNVLFVVKHLKEALAKTKGD